MSEKQKVEVAPPELATLIYVGAVRGDGKIWHEYQHVTLKDSHSHYVSVELLPTDHWSFAKKICRCQPGTVFTIHKSPNKDGSVRMGTDTFIGLWSDEEKRLEWQAASRANEQSHEEATIIEKLKVQNVRMEALAPFARAYSRLAAGPRRQLLAEVIRVITSGRAE